MHVKANENGSVVVVESGNEKVIIAQTPYGTMVTGEEDGEINFTPILGEVDHEFLAQEFSPETAQKIATCLGIVIQQIESQLEALEEHDDTIDVEGEEVERYYLE